MPFCGNDEVLDKPHRPRSEGHSCVTTRAYQPIRRWIQAETRPGRRAPARGQDSRYASLFALLQHAGPHRGEALALQWSDVDLDKAPLRVCGTPARVEGRL